MGTGAVATPGNGGRDELQPASPKTRGSSAHRTPKENVRLNPPACGRTPWATALEAIWGNTRLVAGEYFGVEEEEKSTVISLGSKICLGSMYQSRCLPLSSSWLRAHKKSRAPSVILTMITSATRPTLRFTPVTISSVGFPPPGHPGFGFTCNFRLLNETTSKDLPSIKSVCQEPFAFYLSANLR